jgi:diadenylate cyclase
MNALRHLIFHNIGLKLFSIALAFTLWLMVHRDPVAEVAIEVPIEFHNVPPNLEISSDTLYRSVVRLRGPERVIHGLSPSDVHAEIDLSGLRPGERTFDLTARQIQEPRELEVVQIVPSQFHIAFDNILNRDIPVKPRIVGGFASGYEIAQVLVNPPTVSISGPQKRVEAVESAITDPIDVSGLLQQGAFVRHAYVSDPLIQVANPNPVHITVIMKQATAGSVH